MKQRVITAIFLNIVVALAFVLRQFVSTYIFDALLCLVIIVSANEVSRVFNRSGRLNNSTLITIYPIVSYVVFFFCMKFNCKVWFILLMNLALIAFFMLVETIVVLLTQKYLKAEFEKTKLTKSFSRFCLNKVLLTGFIMLYPSFLLSSMFFLNNISSFAYLNSANFGQVDFGLFLLLLSILTTVATDTFAYFVGSLIKGPKLCPLISPNKTISGAIGGVFGGIIFAFSVYAIFVSCGLLETLLPAYVIVIYAVLGSVLSEIGDIFASIIKRKARTKDYSSIFPGHGGFMDRLDGISFNVLFTLLFFMLFIF
ncbi:MAG: phosphatidate cytidylyltransferase [Christensenellales bacterium]